MSTPNDGGPAFPQPFDDGQLMHGMTLRDYFAAKAMSAMFASGMVEAANQAGIDPLENEKAVAFSAYKMADAMIAERNKRA